MTTLEGPIPTLPIHTWKIYFLYVIYINKWRQECTNIIYTSPHSTTFAVKINIKDTLLSKEFPFLFTYIVESFKIFKISMWIIPWLAILKGCWCRTNFSYTLLPVNHLPRDSLPRRLGTTHRVLTRMKSLVIRFQTLQQLSVQDFRSQKTPTNNSHH